MRAAILFSIFSLGASTYAQKLERPRIPSVYSNIHYAEDGRLYFDRNGERFYERQFDAPLTLENMKGNPIATETGILFDFGIQDFAGTLHYGFIPYGDSKHPLPVYFHSPAKIDSGRSEINIKRDLDGLFDMVGWEKKGLGTLGYRVVHSSGAILYDGKISFKGTGPFQIATTILEGPFINLLQPDGVTISFETNKSVKAKITVGDTSFSDEKETTHHEIKIHGLHPNTRYEYTIRCEDIEQTYSLKTAHLPGARSDFVFSYCSDSRSGRGGGERDIFGANAYIMKRIMALNVMKDVAFCQFTGDLINGYLTSLGQMQLQYANWKRAVEPFAHHSPMIVGMGNHEAFNYLLRDSLSGVGYKINRFPFETESTESLFAENFVNPLNGPVSEDGASYDPDTRKTDFPSYSENVFYYTYDNVAMVVLNSNYFFVPSKSGIPLMGGGLHGYVMDNQLKWMAETVQKLEADNTIDHIFVTIHTPFFPNGGHVKDDMWYHGNNDFRSYVAGKPLKKGIIERRDELLDILVNKSHKVVALLTGDEHNYNVTKLTPETKIYPENYEFPKIKLSRTIYQINNGAAGAPYYAQETTPWTPFVSGFTTQNALVFIHVAGKKISVEVINPDTLEEIDRYQLR